MCIMQGLKTYPNSTQEVEEFHEMGQLTWILQKSPPYHEGSMVVLL